MRQIIISIRIMILEKRLEIARKRLVVLYMKNEPNDSRKMCKARDRFNRRCNQWNQLEAKYEASRK